MTQTVAYQDFPLVTPLVRAITHRAAPFVVLVLVVLGALVAAIASFGPVVLTLTATVLVPCIFVILIGFSLP